MRKRFWFLLLLTSFGLFLLSQCKHEPILPEGFDPNNNNTNNNNGNNNNNSNNNNNNGALCEPGVIYFEKDVLPIMSSSCAVPGCHNAPNGQDGVVFVSYNSVMASGEVDPGRPGNSDVYENLVATDPDKHMPPPGSGITLTTQQINIIRDWIAQGAQNLSCDENAGGCDSVNVSFSGDVQPIINNNCRGCHSGATPQKGVDLTAYTSMMTVINDGRLLKAITHSPGVAAMPYNQPKLDDCKIAQVRNWINEGALNN